MTTRAERIQEGEREQEFGKQEDSSSRTSPTAEDRPIRGPRGGLRAPGPAITRHRQTIHKASRAEQRGGEEEAWKGGKISRAVVLLWMGLRCLCLWSFGWSFTATTKVLSKLFSRASRNGKGPGEMEAARGEEAGKRRMNVGYRSFVASGRSPSLFSLSLSLYLRELIFGQPTESRTEWKVSALESLLEEISSTGDNHAARIIIRVYEIFRWKIR